MLRYNTLLNCRQRTLLQRNLYISRAFASTLSSSSSLQNDTPPPTLPSQARVVIVVGGIIGCSVAFHLAKLGWTDVLLLERGTLSCGTTWHAAGLIGQLRRTQSETQLSQYGSRLYETLEDETGQATGFRRTGSLTLAQTDDRLIELRRRMGKCVSYGIDAEIISPQEANNKVQGMLRTEDLKGALWLPGDGTANSSDLTQAFAKGARKMGVKIVERVRATGFSITNGTVTGVNTTSGNVTADIVVNCGGQWARELGRMAGVAVPLHSAEHYYVVTKPLSPSVDVMCPVFRDLDSLTYFREWSGGLIAGVFEMDAKPVFGDGIPDGFEFQLLPDDWDHFMPAMEAAMHRVPLLESAEVKMVNGPESFTPDGQYIVGEAPELRNFYVAAGMNSSGIASAGGCGKLLADWIVNGQPTQDVWSIDIRRFAPYHSNPNFLLSRTRESLGLHYSMGWPRHELDSGRPLRRTPLYDRLRGVGAVFGQKFSWERVNYFTKDSDAEKIQSQRLEDTFWFPPKLLADAVKSEVLATRDNVAVFDQTSFAKYIIQGRDAASFMSRLCAGNVNVENGNIVYTGLLNHRGGYETDVTVTRLSNDSYYVVSPTAQATRDYDWIRRNINSNEHVVCFDVTSARSVLSVMGPKSRLLLSSVSKTNFSNEKFPFGTAKDIDIGAAIVRAHRVTYVGELGWELHIPTEMTAHVWDVLMSEKNFNVTNAGYYAIDCLRVEKGYRAWGHELTPDDTPLETGLAFAVQLDKPTGFIGQQALQKQKIDGVNRRIANIVFDDPLIHPYGGEPIYRNGDICGFLTSAAYGYKVGSAVALGWIKNKHGKVSPAYVRNDCGKYEIDVNGKLTSVKVSLKCPYDPTNDRVKA